MVAEFSLWIIRSAVCNAFPATNYSTLGSSLKPIFNEQRESFCSTFEAIARFTKWPDNVEVVRLGIFLFATLYEFSEIPFFQ